MTIEEIIEKLEKSDNVNDQKRAAIFKEVMAGANRISKWVKLMPRRRFYVKKINRRPMKKKKKALLYSQMCLSTLLTATKIYHIQTQPIPRYSVGGNESIGGLPIVYDFGKPEEKVITGMLIRKGVPDSHNNIITSFNKLSQNPRIPVILDHKDPPLPPFLSNGIDDNQV